MYGKMFRQMYHGTLATTGPWQALVTFQQFIVLADKDGIVDMTPESIARETTLPLEIILAGIAKLEQPDPDSRTPDEDGRRIIRLSESRAWGWRITNYLHYRQLRSEEERREYHRQYWHTRKLNKTQHTQIDSTHSTNAEAVSSKHKQEVDKTKNTVPQSGTATGAKAESVRRVFAHWQQVHRHPKSRLDSKRERIIRSALDGYSEDDLCKSIAGYLNSPHHMGENDRSQVYDDIEIFLRDSKHIEAGIRYHDSPPRNDLSTNTRRNVAAIAEWIPPEMRNAD